MDGPAEGKEPERPSARVQNDLRPNDFLRDVTDHLLQNTVTALTVHSHGQYDLQLTFHVTQSARSLTVLSLTCPARSEYRATRSPSLGSRLRSEFRVVPT